MEPKIKIRPCADLVREKFDDEQQRTVTSKDQIATEILAQRCFERFEQLMCLDHGHHDLPKIYRKEHLEYLSKSLQFLPSFYECLDSSRPWMIYWILNASAILNHHYDSKLLDNVVDFLVKCRSPEGGFGGGPGQYPHLATTYAAVNSLCIIGTEKAYKAIDKKSLNRFLHSVRESNGAFRMHLTGELDVRGAYCAISSAKLSNFTDGEEHELFEKTAEWIASCQTYEGGFGGTPDLEAHGGYSFCAAAGLALLGKGHLCDLKSLLRWTLNRQMRYEGGFQGRTNKLVDGCYSFWQAAILPIVQALIANTYTDEVDLMAKSLFDRHALQEYVLMCCQNPNGGLVDKPTKPVDLYHTCYTLSGLAVAQHCEIAHGPVVVGCHDNEVLPTHPLHNIPPTAVVASYKYYHADEDEPASLVEVDDVVAARE